jgi:thymidylate synthase (FAD)
MHVVEPVVELLNAEELKDFYVRAGKFAAICYDSSTKPEKIGKHVIEHGHATAYRNNLMFRYAISGVSRVWSHEDVRHKIGVHSGGPEVDIPKDEMDSNQRSQRYVAEDDFGIIIPKELRAQGFIVDVLVPDTFGTETQRVSLSFEDVARIVQQWYQEAVASGIRPEIARYVLLNATETKVNKVFSFQALQHYCSKRLCTAAQPEMREVTQLMVQEIKDKVSEELASYFVPQCDPKALGYCPEAKSRWCGRRPHKSEVIPD